METEKDVVHSVHQPTKDKGELSEHNNRGGLVGPVSRYQENIAKIPCRDFETAFSFANTYNGNKYFHACIDFYSYYFDQKCYVLVTTPYTVDLTGQHIQLKKNLKY